MSQHEMSSILERDETFNTNLQAAYGRYVQGKISLSNLNHIRAWLVQSAMRRFRDSLKQQEVPHAA